MSRKTLFWILTVLIGFVFHMFSSGFLSIFGVFPNILLLFTIFFGLLFGPVAGVSAGFVWGLFADTASISIFGSQAFMLTAIGFISGRLQGKIDEEKPVAQMGLVFVMSIIFLAGMYFFEVFFGESGESFGFTSVFFQPLYSTIICPVIFRLLAGWCVLFRRR